MVQVRLNAFVRSRWFYALVFAMALLIRVHDLSKDSFSFDESSSLLYSSFPEWRALFWDNNPFFYHLILRLWLYIAPLTEFWTRLLSCLISAAGVVAMYHLGLQLKSVRRALFATAVLLFSSVSIRYAESVRMYALFEALTTILMIASLMLLQTSSKRQSTQVSPWFRNRAWVLFSCTSVVLILTHICGVIPVSMALTILVHERVLERRVALRIAGLSVTVLIALLLNSFRIDAVYWQKAYRQMLGYEVDLSSMLRSFGQATMPIAVGFFSLALLATRHRQRAVRRVSTALAVMIAALFWLLSLLSWLDGRNLFLVRYFIFLNPILIMMAAFGIEELSKRLLRWLPKLAGHLPWVAGVFFAIAFQEGYLSARSAWREAAEYVNQHRGQIVLTTRSRALEVPYFQAYGIKIEPLDFSADTAAKIKQRIESEGPVWIVDNVWSEMTYLRVLLAQLQLEDVAVERMDFVREDADPVFAIRVGRDD